MCENFLENIHRILVFIRSDISNYNNIELIRILISGVNKELANSDIIKLVFHVSPSLEQQLILQDGEMHKIDKRHKDFMLEVLHSVCEELEAARYDNAHELVDMLHVFPQIVARNNVKSVEDFGKTYVMPLMRKGLMNHVPSCF